MGRSDSGQVFLGGACGTTAWRKQIAIPLLEAAGVSYYDPQLGSGEWTQSCEAAEMRAKAAADVLLFVIGGETRGVASIGEAAYYLGAGRSVALAIVDVGEGASIGGSCVDSHERDDLNRGRIFVRTMARQHGVPVFDDVESAVRYAIEMTRERKAPMSAERLRAILSEVRFKQSRFEVEEAAGGFLIQLCGPETDTVTGQQRVYRGRRWYVEAGSGRSAVVRTAFLAAQTWQEHEAREMFQYRGARLFGPHFEADALVRLCEAGGADVGGADEH
jgi:hypothetical protein